MDFENELKARVDEINRMLVEYMPEEAGPQSLCAEAMNYSLSAGGKRLRPLLMAETFRIFGGSGEEAEPFMAALEMIHTYSLVHDDLPAMDNDEYRRGKKSTHAAYGEAMGILSGDALLNRAFEVAAAAVERNCVPKTARAMRVLAEKAGLDGMIGGQVVDLASEGKEISRETLRFMQEKKTSALLEAAMMIGAILAGAKEEEIAQVELAAREIGLAFQIRDDILDVTGNAEELGKPIGSDEKNGKVTWVTLVGLAASERMVKDLSESAIFRLRGLDREDAFLTALIRSLTERKS